MNFEPRTNVLVWVQPGPRNFILDPTVENPPLCHLIELVVAVRMFSIAYRVAFEPSDIAAQALCDRRCDVRYRHLVRRTRPPPGRRCLTCLRLFRFYKFNFLSLQRLPFRIATGAEIDSETALVALEVVGAEA